MKLPGLLLLVLVTACSQPNKQEHDALPESNDASLPITANSVNDKNIEDYYGITGDSLILPAFIIEVKLSEKAEEKLKTANETVIVSASFGGVPTDTTVKAYQEWGQIIVANTEIELTGSRTATFNKVKISKKAYDSLADKDVEVLINIYSGRRSSPNNILETDMLQEPISKARQQVNVLTGKLIGETP